MTRHLTYTKRAGPKLKAIVEELRSGDKSKLDLRDEIAVAQSVLENAFALFGKALEGDVEKTLQLALGQKVLEATSHVQALQVAQSKLQIVSDAFVSVEDMDAMILQVIRALRDHLMPDHEELLDRVLEDLNRVSAVTTRKKSSVNITIT